MCCALKHGTCVRLLSGVLPVPVPSIQIDSRGFPWQGMRFEEKDSALGRKSRVLKTKRKGIKRIREKREKMRRNKRKGRRDNLKSPSLLLFGSSKLFEVGTSRKSACKHPELGSGVNAWVALLGNLTSPCPAQPSRETELLPGNPWKPPWAL